MSIRIALKKIRSFWSPKMERAPGSLYDFVLEEEERQRQKTHPKDIFQSDTTISAPNFTYTAHVMVISTVSACVFASQDIIFLMQQTQTILYSAMSTWIGKPDDPEIITTIVFLKGLSITEVLNNFYDILKYLEITNPKSHQEIISTIFGPLYEDMTKVQKKMDQLAKVMVKHLKDITPMMLKYSTKDFSSQQFKSKQNNTTLSNKTSLLTYGPEFENITTEKSVSMIILPPVSSKLGFRFQRVFKSIRRVWKVLTCASRKKTEIIRAPNVGITDETQVSSFEPSKISVLPPPITNLPPELMILTQPDQFTSSSNSTCIMDNEMKEKLIELGFSLSNFNEEKAMTKSDLVGPNYPESFDTDLENNFSESEDFTLGYLLPKDSSQTHPMDKPKCLTELTQEDISLQNTTDVSYLHEPIKFSQTESSTYEFLNESRDDKHPTSMRLYSATFPEDPLTYILNRVTEFRKIVSIISSMIREVETKFSELKPNELRSDPNRCMEFADIVRIMKEKATLLDFIENYDIYQEEEVLVTGSLMNVYRESIKSADQFRKFADMIKTDMESFYKLLKEFHAEEILGLRQLLASHNEKFIELKRCSPFSQGFKGIKLPRPNFDLNFQNSKSRSTKFR